MSESFPEYTEVAGTCEECGNSPVNHLLVKISYTLDIATAYLFGNSKKTEAHKNVPKSEYFIDTATKIFFTVCYWLRIVRYADNPDDAKTYRSRVIWQEANRRHIPVQQVVFFGIKTDTYRAKLGKTWMHFDSLPIPAHYRCHSAVSIDDKIVLKRVLFSHGISVPRAESFWNYAAAQKFLDAIGSSVVVKPRMGSRGRHTTVFVKTPNDLKRAFKSAQKLCALVAVEEYIPGSICRGTVINGKLAGFFQADPLVIQGDGVSSLASLIEKANTARNKRVAEVIVNNETRQFLQRFGYTLDSILESGKKIPIGHRTGRLFGGETRELLESVHPRLREYLEKAANALHIAVVGFDVVIADPQRDPDMQRWGIIEANTLPFIDLHYLPLHGTPSNPAAAIWDLWPVARV